MYSSFELNTAGAADNPHAQNAAINRRLMTLYQRLHAALHPRTNASGAATVGGKGGGGGGGGGASVQYLRTSHEAVLGWVSRRAPVGTEKRKPRKTDILRITHKDDERVRVVREHVSVVAARCDGAVCAEGERVGQAGRGEAVPERQGGRSLLKRGTTLQALWI